MRFYEPRTDWRTDQDASRVNQRTADEVCNNWYQVTQKNKNPTEKKCMQR